MSRGSRSRRIQFDVSGGQSAPAAARRELASKLSPQLAPATLYEVSLLLSELVTNAVRHGGAGKDDRIGIDVQLRADSIRVCVTDPGEGFERPATPRAHPGGQGGNGLPCSRSSRASGTWSAGSRPASGSRCRWRAPLRPGQQRLMRLRRPYSNSEVRQAIEQLWRELLQTGRKATRVGIRRALPQTIDPAANLALVARRMARGALEQPSVNGTEETLFEPGSGGQSPSLRAGTKASAGGLL